MTQAPTLNGQVIGQAERATRAVLERLLEETNTPFVNWVALNLVATQGEMTQEALVGQLTAGLRINEVEAASAVTGLADGTRLVITDLVRLTSEGEALYGQISAGVAGITERLYTNLPREDLVVARRVLETLTDRARAELIAG
jgi:hypothetical protein